MLFQQFFRVTSRYREPTLYNFERTEVVCGRRAKECAWHEHNVPSYAAAPPLFQIPAPVHSERVRRTTLRSTTN
jgi:hypothetical protein